MLIAYLRSSSYGQYDMCQFSYFMQYVLGWKTPSGKAADIGSISHKVLEFLAKKKLAIDTRTRTFYDEETEKEYKTETKIEDFIEAAWQHYTTGPAKHHIWKSIDKKAVYNHVHTAVTYKDGMYNPLKMNVLSCEEFFDLEIDQPWAKYEYDGPDGKPVKGTLAIKGTMDLLTEKSPKVLEYVDWKGLPRNTEIPTPNGWTTMGDLKVGDEVFDKDGKITKVIGKSHSTFKPCYKITFDDKTTVVCDKDHLWTLHNGSVVNILNLKKRDKISVAKPIETEDKILPIDPYVLGLWLGDGRNRGGEICKPDDFVFEEIQRRGYKIGKNIGGKNRCQSKTVEGLTTKLNKLNLINNKHIPHIYFRASFRQRLDLLRGLMDSDGNVNSVRKQAVFTSCNKNLSDNVKELLLTLGQRVNQCKTKQSGFGITVTAYPLHFRPININPFLLPRKAEKIDPIWGPGKSNIRLIKNIERVEDMFTECIMVDSPSNTYLCTKNMIPTHNTGRRYDWAKEKVKEHEDLVKDFQVRLYHYALAKKFPKYNMYMMTFFFTKDGGPFHMIFEKDFEFIFGQLKKRFEEIKKNNNPKLHKDWKCTKLCHFGKTLNKDSTFYKGVDNGKTICETMNEEVQQLGLDRITKKYKGFENAFTYLGGGGLSDRTG